LISIVPFHGGGTGTGSLVADGALGALASHANEQSASSRVAAAGFGNLRMPHPRDENDAELGRKCG
jgi:hypothetical protein